VIWTLFDTPGSGFESLHGKIALALRKSVIAHNAKHSGGGCERFKLFLKLIEFFVNKNMWGFAKPDDRSLDQTASIPVVLSTNWKAASFSEHTNPP